MMLLCNLFVGRPSEYVHMLLKFSNQPISALSSAYNKPGPPKIPKETAKATSMYTVLIMISFFLHHWNCLKGIHGA